MPSRRAFLRDAAAASAFQAARAQTPESRMPNILYIHSHDSGHYIQPYGHAVPTPNLHKLASDGVRFRRAVATFRERRPQKPFFLDVGSFDPHRVYPQPTAADDPRYPQPPMPMPDTPATHLDTARFHASARILDHGVGQVLDALERNGL